MVSICLHNVHPGCLPTNPMCNTPFRGENVIHEYRANICSPRIINDVVESPLQDITVIVERYKIAQSVRGGSGVATTRRSACAYIDSALAPKNSTYLARQAAIYDNVYTSPTLYDP